MHVDPALPWLPGNKSRSRCQCQGIRNNEPANIQEHNWKAIRGLGCATKACEPWCKPWFICNGNSALVPTLEAKFRPEFVEGRASGQERRWHGLLSFSTRWKSVCFSPLGCTLPSPGIIEFVLEHVDGVLDGLHLAHQPLQRQVVRQLHVRPARPGVVMLSFRSFEPFFTTSPKFI